VIHGIYATISATESERRLLDHSHVVENSRENRFMRAVLGLFWQICTLRNTAAAVPGASWFLGTVVVLNCVVSLILSLVYNAEVGWQQALTTIVVGQATVAALVWTALSLRGFLPRFPSTITALFGCDLVITALFGALLPIAGLLGPEAIRLLPPLLLIWSVAVYGYILHQALELPMFAGVLMALGMLFVSLFVGQLVTAP
jgi:uncharacterized membrane protein YfbV (UPF0208 family)